MSIPVAQDCGVFVSSSKGNDGNPGTKAEPFASIGKALGAAKGKPIYLCAEPFVEAVVVGGGALIYGGLDCAIDWDHIGATQQTSLTAPAGEIPLRVGANKSVELYDIRIRAVDADKPGASSIALLAESLAEVSLSRCWLDAGKGADGADGEGLADTASPGQNGASGAMACTDAVVEGADGPIHDCDGVDAVGGFGGLGADGSAGNGTSGEPFMNANFGAGEKAATVCQIGSSGAAGPTGAPGEGAVSPGELSASGFFSPTGKDGQAGKVGQGGGGGGGARGGGAADQCAAWPMTNGNGGASGGSGGAGGCGGKGGKGGASGGASIAILSLGAMLVFDDVKMTAQAGGKGGNGGIGQLGGAGGFAGAGGTVPAGVALLPACAGGDGGPGGSGGRGGGGRGGHSIGIAYTGQDPVLVGASIAVSGPGDGGTGEGMAGKGAAGVTAPVQSF